jgi:hypothetical protein
MSHGALVPPPDGVGFATGKFDVPIERPVVRDVITDRRSDTAAASTLNPIARYPFRNRRVMSFPYP